MKLTTPFTILNRTFNEMDFIKNALVNERVDINAGGSVVLNLMEKVL